MSAEGKVSFKLKRFSGIKRDYTPEEVERLKALLKLSIQLLSNNQKNFGLY